MKKSFAILVILGMLFGLVEASLAVASVGVDINTSASTNVSVSGSKSASSTHSEGTLPTQASATATTKANLGADIGPLTIDRDGLALGSTTVKTISVASVSIQSEADLRALAEKVIAADERVKLIKITADETEVTYEYNGKFLGIIPIKPALRASVDSEGEVEVSFPWYDIFVRHTGEVDSGAAVAAAASSSVSSAIKNQTALNARGRALVALASTLKAQAE